MNTAHEVRVYCPTEHGYVNGALRQIAGGTTVYDATGKWNSPTGETFEEDVKVVTSVVTDENLPPYAESVEELAEWLAEMYKDSTDETEVMYEVRETKVGFK